MKKMKKIISLILCCCMIFGMMSTSAMAKEQPNKVVAQGFCGTATLVGGTQTGNVWELNAAGVLTIVGVYDSRKNPIPMPDYARSSSSSSVVPWADYRDDIKAVKITGVLPNIGMNAFWGCTNLKTVSLPEGLTLIGESAFNYCTSLTTVEIPESVQTVEGYAFYQCDALESVFIYGKNTQLDAAAFLSADRDQLEFYLYEGAAAYEGIAEALYTVHYIDGTCGTGMVDKANTWLFKEGVLTIVGNYDSQKTPILMPNYSVDDSNPAPWGAFRNYIKSVVIEGVLPNIGEGAFSRCESLTSITFGENIILIGADAFYGCRALKSIVIPETVGGIGSMAFEFCNALESVTILRKEMSLGEGIFGGCPNVVIYCLSGSDIATYAAENEIAYELLDAETPEPTPVTEIFSDVKADQWYEDAVQFVYDNGIMSGSNGLFKPTENITRQQVVSTLYSMEGEPAVTDYTAVSELKDLNAGEWYTKAVCWGYNTGVATGNSSTKMFGIGNPITRQQLAMMLMNYAEYKGYDTDTRGTYPSDLLGVDKVADYAAEAMQWAYGTGLLSGSKTTVNGVTVYDLKPTGYASRAQMASIIMNFVENNKSATVDL